MTEKDGHLCCYINTHFRGCNGIGDLLTRQARNCIYTFYRCDNLRFYNLSTLFQSSLADNSIIITCCVQFEDVFKVQRESSHILTKPVRPALHPSTDQAIAE